MLFFYDNDVIFNPMKPQKWAALSTLIVEPLGKNQYGLHLFILQDTSISFYQGSKKCTSTPNSQKWI